MSKYAAALVFIVLNYYVYWFLASTDVIPERPHFEVFPQPAAGWTCLGRETLDEKVRANLGVTDYLSCAFVDPTQANSTVHLYVGYHERQIRDDTGKETSIHPPEHCLPGSGWDVIDSQIVHVPYGGGGQAKRFIIAKGNQRQLVYFWYQSRGRILASSLEKMLYMFYDRLTRGRTDGSLVRFTIPIESGDIDAAEATFDRFAHAITPILDRHIPH